MSLKIKPEYQEQVWNEIETSLNALPTAGAQHAWLQNTKLGSKGIKVQSLLDSNPELKSQVAAYMLGSFAAKEGNPSAGGFSLSSSVSDKQILNAIDDIKKNKKIVDEHPVFGDEEKLTELIDFIRDKDKKVPVIKEDIANLKHFILEQEAEFIEGTTLNEPFEYGEEGEGMVERLGQKVYSIFNQPGLTNPGKFSKLVYREHEDGSKTVNPFTFVPAAVTNSAIKWLTQVGAGWTDLDFGFAGKKEGQDMLENYRFDYNYDTGEMGSDFFEKMKPYKEKLIELDEQQQALDSDTSEESDLYNVYKQLSEDDRDLRLLLESTRFDEMLHYMNRDDLIKHLETINGQ